MLEAKGQEAADDLPSAQAAVPECESRSLFGLGVPSTADEYESGNNASLENSKKDAGC
jgi:hypothetical protein